jgi:hypothetical protein
MKRTDFLILVALLDLDFDNDQLKLKLYVDPHWRELVQTEDRDYLESLLKDLVERAQQEPETIFKQLSSLGVGPVVTAEVGTNFSESAKRSSLIEHFLQL